ncbi:hypothetical protein BJX99DRAFT_240155 [Aspergillus californicus]
MSQSADTTARRVRRFLPEPIETSSRSFKKQQDNPPVVKQPHLIQEIPFEQSDQQIYKQQEGLRANLFPENETEKQQSSPRKFTPQLMETARHSFRPGNQPHTIENSPEHQKRMLYATDMASGSLVGGHSVAHESRFSYTSLLRRREIKRHSFRVPDLPAIPSSCSDESNDPSPTPLPASLPAASRKSESHSANRRRLGDYHEAHFSEYILPFPLHPSENELKEQTLAAFPNEQVYQPVDHFAIDMEEEESPAERGSHFQDARLGFKICRRASSGDLASELESLRRHKEESGRKKRHYPNTRRAWLSNTNRRNSRTTDKLRQVASPPMLGGDIVFPQSRTPGTTVCEGTQTNGSKNGCEMFSVFSGLWSGNTRPSDHLERDGLWNGTCKVSRHTSTHGNEALLPGLITPRHDLGADIRGFSTDAPKPASQRQKSNLMIQELGSNVDYNDYTDHEYNSGFVTQIYNYLSLGYPSVARYYDYELSKVSGVPVSTLREDDLNTDARGHVRLHDATGNGDVNSVCMRWTALRLYIEEWARQQPRMLEADCYHEAWGVRERKGSWAV